MNNKRLPLAEQEKLVEGEVWNGRVEDTKQMAWLYGPDLGVVMGSGLRDSGGRDVSRVTKKGL